MNSSCVLCRKRTKKKKKIFLTISCRRHRFKSEIQSITWRPLWICLNWRKQRSCRLCFAGQQEMEIKVFKMLFVCFFAADAFLLGVPINIHVSRSLLSQRKKNTPEKKSQITSHSLIFSFPALGRFLLFKYGKRLSGSPVPRLLD